jgi:recombination protein RecT
MPMIAGIRKRMRNSGEVLSAEAHVIYEGDEFQHDLGDQPCIVHQPAFKDRGKPIGAYAIIKLVNGEVLREVMSLEEIERVRAVSKVKFGPWQDWWGEMARKTVLRRCAKAAPTSSDVDAVLARDDTMGVEGEFAEVPPPRPVRTTLVAPVDMAAAGHDDLDAGYRQTMDGTIPDADDDDDADQADQADQAGSSAYDQQVRRRLCIETNRAAIDKWLEKHAAHLAAYRDIDPKNAGVLDEWIAALPISPGSHVDQAGRELTEVDAG